MENIGDGWEWRDWGELGLFALGVLAAMGLDARDPTGGKCGVGAELLVFGDDGRWGTGQALSDGGDFVGEGVAEGVPEGGVVPLKVEFCKRVGVGLGKGATSKPGVFEVEWVPVEKNSRLKT